MRRVLLDVNVILDVLLDRRPHADASIAIWKAVERREIEGVISAHGVTTIFYLVARRRDSRTARTVLGQLMRLFGVAPVDESVIRHALDLGGSDFEDAVSAAAAESASCDAIVTRDRRGFPQSPVPILDPIAARALMSESRGPRDASEPAASYGSGRQRRTSGAGRIHPAARGRAGR